MVWCSRCAVPSGGVCGELGEGFFPVGGELALDEAGWGGAFAGGFALVLVAFAGALGSSGGPPRGPLQGTNRMEERTGGARAGPWAMDWGQVASIASGRPVGPSHSPARSAPRREAPASTIKRAPLRRFGATGAPVKEAPSSAWTQTFRVLNSPSTAAPTAMRPLRSGRLGGRRGAMGADRARGWITGKEGLQRPALPLQDGVAHRVATLGDCSRSEAAPIVDARWWPIRALSCPGVQADDH